MDPKPDFLVPGVPEAPRTIDKKILDTQFGRENLSATIMKALNTASKDPVDVEYLERQIKVWNNMEEQKRGFKGHSRVFYKERRTGGKLSVIYFPESDSVQLGWKAATS